MPSKGSGLSRSSGGWDELPTVVADRTAELAGRAVVLGVPDRDDARLVLDALGLLERLSEARKRGREAS